MKRAEAVKGKRLASMTAGDEQLSFDGAPLRNEKWKAPLPVGMGESTTMKYLVPAVRVTDRLSPFDNPL